MTEEIQPNDVVVAITDSDPHYPGDPVVRGKAYRVDAVFSPRSTGEIGISLRGMKPYPMLGYQVSMFRKLQVAEASFAADMRACKQVRA